MQQQQPGSKRGASLPRGGRRRLAAAGLASTAALLLLCTLNNGPNDGTHRLRDERQLGFGQAAGGGPIDRVSKVLSHAFKPRVGGHKGQDVGGPWVHKALGSDDPIERPTLLAGEEPQPQPAEVEPLVAPATATDSTPKRADAVLHLGGGLRQGQHRNLQAPAPATFGVKKVVPVDEVKGGGGKDGDKGLLKKHGTGHKTHGHAHPHKAATLHKHAAAAKPGLKKPAHGHRHTHGHKTDPHAKHGHKKQGHTHGALKHPVKHMAAQAHKTKKAAVHAVEKAALKGKVHKAQIEKHIEKQAAVARAKAKKAAVQAVKTAHNIKHAHGVKAKPLGHGHEHGHKKTHLHGGQKQNLHKVAKKTANHVHKTAKKTANRVQKTADHVHNTAAAAAAAAHVHGYKKDGHLHQRALQQQAAAAQAAVAERLNLSPDDVAALRAIARDAALDVIKDAVRDAGYDLPDFALPAGTDDGDASKDQGAMDDEMVDGGLFFSGLEDGEGDMALFEPLDLGLEDVLAALGDRQQVVGAAEPPAAAAGATAANTTTTTTTNTTEAAKEDGTDDDAGDAGFLLSALRQMNLTAPEADRLRTRARSAAESAIRDAAAEAGYTGSNLDTLINSFAAARADAPAPATRRQLWSHNGVGGHDAWLADRAHHDSHHASGSGGSSGYYGAADDEEVADAWGFYDEAAPRSGYADYRDGTVGSRGGRASYGDRRLHWRHHHDDDEAEDAGGPWDAWADRAEASGYFVDDEAVEDFFE